MSRTTVSRDPAVSTGIVLGLLQSFAAGYAPESFGDGFAQVVPWIMMILILVIRPTGLFGSREIRRA